MTSSDEIFKDMNSEESIRQQLKLWVAGKAVHNPVTDECCPDFSCCNGKGLAPIEVRERFQQAVNEKDEHTQMEMLGMFLGQAFSDENVYVAGMDIPSEC